MITVKDILKRGGAGTCLVTPDDTVYRALQVMAENNVGAVMVCDGTRMVGIFTERDYCRKIILMGRSSLNTTLQEIMTKNMITVGPDKNLQECMELMTKYHIRHLPVQEGDNLIGIVSMRDVMEAIIASKEKRIEQLESYILGADYGR